jgi:hypothetical protein
VQNGRMLIWQDKGKFADVIGSLNSHNQLFTFNDAKPETKLVF